MGGWFGQLVDDVWIDSNDDRTWRRAQAQVDRCPGAHRLYAVQHRAAQRGARQPAVAADGHRQALVVVVLLDGGGVGLCIDGPSRTSMPLSIGVYLLEPQPGGEGLPQEVGLDGRERNGVLVALVVGRREGHAADVELVLEALEAEEAGCWELGWVLVGGWGDRGMTCARTWVVVLGRQSPGRRGWRGALRVARVSAASLSRRLTAPGWIG